MACGPSWENPRIVQVLYVGHPETIPGLFEYFGIPGILEESATSPVYKLRPNRQKLCWLLSADMTCLFHLLEVRIALNLCISMNLVEPGEIIAVAFVIVHAGSGKSRCLSVLPFVYLFSILPHESINMKENI